MTRSARVYLRRPTNEHSWNANAGEAEGFSVRRECGLVAIPADVALHSEPATRGRDCGFCNVSSPVVSELPLVDESGLDLLCANAGGHDGTTYDRQEEITQRAEL